MREACRQTGIASRNSSPVFQKRFSGDEANAGLKESSACTRGMWAMPWDTTRSQQLVIMRVPCTGFATTVILPKASCYCWTPASSLDSLYTADIARTLPIDGAFQRRAADGL